MARVRSTRRHNANGSPVSRPEPPSRAAYAACATLDGTRRGLAILAWEIATDQDRPVFFASLTPGVALWVDEGKARERMKQEPEEGADKLLGGQPAGRRGLAVKLDRGFQGGTYAVYVEFDELAERIGFVRAHRKAMRFTKLLKDKLSGFAGYSLDKTEDASADAAPGRERDLELTYLTFPVTMDDGRFHDRAMQAAFQPALLRANQQWDQMEARASTERHDRRRADFRLQLRRLLAGETYGHVDSATKKRLVEEVAALAYPSPGQEL